KKESEIKQLRDAFEITNYGSITEIHISNKQLLHDCLNSKNTKISSSSEYGTTISLMNKKQLSLLSQILNEFKDQGSEEAWIYINSTLEKIFGYENILKSSNN
ncbi:238_t:CDS:2, partial [Racocetra persica]